MPPVRNKDTTTASSRRVTAPSVQRPVVEPEPPVDEEEQESAVSQASSSGSEAEEETNTTTTGTTTATTAKAAKLAARAAASAAPPPATAEPAAKAPGQKRRPSEMLHKTMSTLSLSEFTGFVGREEKNAKFIAINNQQIPCQTHMFKSDKVMAFKITIISARSAGFSKAPYKMSFDKSKVAAVNSTAKPLAELDTSVNGTSVMHMYLYDKDGAAPDRGPRRDDCRFTVETGDTFIFFVNPKDLARTGMMMGAVPAVPILPTDIEAIPAMSVIEISATTRNVDAATKFRITNIRPVHNFSLLSCMPALRTLAPSIEVARNRLMTKKEQFEFLFKDIEDRDICFYVPSVAAGAIVCDDLLAAHNMISIAGWSASPMDEATRLDIHVETAMRYTNAVSTSFAVTLIQMALEMRAVSFLVFTCDYWARQDECSHLRAVPLIDTSQLLASVEFPGDEEAVPKYVRQWGCITTASHHYEFETGCTFEDEAGTKHEVVIVVSDCVKQQASGETVKNMIADFMLSESADSYVPLVFGLRKPGATSGQPQPLLRVQFRADKAFNARSTAGGGRYKRAKIGCL